MPVPVQCREGEGRCVVLIHCTRDCQHTREPAPTQHTHLHSFTQQTNATSLTTRPHTTQPNNPTQLTHVHTTHAATTTTGRCEIIIGEYEEALETLLYAKDADIFAKVCVKDACKGQGRQGPGSSPPCPFHQSSPLSQLEPFDAAVSR